MSKESKSLVETPLYKIGDLVLVAKKNTVFLGIFEREQNNFMYVKYLSSIHNLCKNVDTARVDYVMPIIFEETALGSGHIGLQAEPYGTEYINFEKIDSIINLIRMDDALIITFYSMDDDHEVVKTFKHFWSLT
jgi:hypothetical protein